MTDTGAVPIMTREHIREHDDPTSIGLVVIDEYDDDDHYYLGYEEADRIELATGTLTTKKAAEAAGYEHHPKTTQTNST